MVTESPILRSSAHLFSPSALRDFPFSFYIILHTIKHYKELFTLSTPFSTSKKPSNTNTFLHFIPKASTLNKCISTPLVTPIKTLHNYFSLATFPPENFFSCWQRLFVQKNNIRARRMLFIMSSCFHHSASLSSMVA